MNKQNERGNADIRGRIEGNVGHIQKVRKVDRHKDRDTRQRGLTTKKGHTTEKMTDRKIVKIELMKHRRNVNEGHIQRNMYIGQKDTRSDRQQKE